MYDVYTVILAGKSPNIRFIYIVNIRFWPTLHIHTPLPHHPRPSTHHTHTQAPSRKQQQQQQKRQSKVPASRNRLCAADVAPAKKSTAPPSARQPTTRHNLRNTQKELFVHPMLRREQQQQQQQQQESQLQVCLMERDSCSCARVPCFSVCVDVG
jgi:hypothetical protein